MRTKRAAAFIAAGAAVALLAACSGGGGGGTGGDSGQSLTILFGSSGDAETTALTDAANAWAEESGNTVEVHYVGVSWATGDQFDASWDRGDTFKFGLGKGQVIKGWDEGVAGMKVGGRRRITIPPQLAYGKRGAGGVIGPDETLVFVVDLVGVR